MKIVFLGSGDFGTATLSHIAGSGHEIVSVVTQPDRRAGRGGKIRQTPIKAKALEMGLPVESPERPNSPEFEQRLRSLNPDLAVVVAYGHLIRPNLLAVPRLGFVNLHASLLPAYRGAAPVPWAIMNGERVSGATVFQLDEKFDTGEILGRVELPILDDDTSGSYLARLAPAGAELMARVLAEMEAGTARPIRQENAMASTARKFKKEDGRINWAKPFTEIERMVRALQPWPQAATAIMGAKGDIRMNVGALVPADPERFAISGVAPGTVLAADAKSGLVVATGDLPARLVRIQPEGKKAMTDVEFLRGAKVKI